MFSKFFFILFGILIEFITIYETNNRKIYLYIGVKLTKEEEDRTINTFVIYLFSIKYEDNFRYNTIYNIKCQDETIIQIIDKPRFSDIYGIKKDINRKNTN